MPRDSLSLTLDLISFVSHVLLSLCSLLSLSSLFVSFHTEASGRLECSSWVPFAFACNRNSLHLYSLFVYENVSVCFIAFCSLPLLLTVSLPSFLLLLSLLLVSVKESCYGIFEKNRRKSLSPFLWVQNKEWQDKRKTRCVSLVLFSHPISCFTLVLLLFFFFTVFFSELSS